MADTKISALTSATTPLAGTEVLPIVQSGSTVKVSVANLTAGRAIDATTGTFTGLLTSSTGPATISTQQGGLKSFCPGFSGQYGGIFFSTPSASIDQIEADIYTSGNTGVPSSKLKVLKDGDVNVTLGNLVIGTSGKGIDFSATAGSGTSELLNDYEEGTWTPSDNSGAGLTFTGVTATYTKIGRLVSAQLYLTYPSTADTNQAKITGLPYTSASGLGWSAGSVFTDAASGKYAVVSQSSTNLSFFNTADNSAALNALFSSRYVIFNFTYFV
jgi:hypothetical protein